MNIPLGPTKWDCYLHKENENHAKFGTVSCILIDVASLLLRQSGMGYLRFLPEIRFF